MPNQICFHLRDMVTWNEKRFPKSMVDEMKERYGNGPFRVVAIRLHTKEAMESLPQGQHPEAVTIELQDGSHKEMTGAWFKK